MSDASRAPEYLYLRPGNPLPQLDGAIFKAVIVIDSETTPEWQAQVADWLVRSGCRYMMAWGTECENWHDKVDYARAAMFDFKDVPEDTFVMTTWHDKESLQETFWFSERCAMHPSLPLEKTYVIDISAKDRRIELLRIYRAAQENTSGETA